MQQGKQTGQLASCPGRLLFTRRVFQFLGRLVVCHFQGRGKTLGEIAHARAIKCRREVFGAQHAFRGVSAHVFCLFRASIEILVLSLNASSCLTARSLCLASHLVRGSIQSGPQYCTLLQLQKGPCEFIWQNRPVVRLAFPAALVVRWKNAFPTKTIWEAVGSWFPALRVRF